VCAAQYHTHHHLTHNVRWLQLIGQIIKSNGISPDSDSLNNLKLAVQSAYAAELSDMSALFFV